MLRHLIRGLPVSRVRQSDQRLPTASATHHIPDLLPIYQSILDIYELATAFSYALLSAVLQCHYSHLVLILRQKDQKQHPIALTQFAMTVRLRGVNYVLEDPWRLRD